MNKGYIKVVLALLSVAGYMQNVVFAIDSISNTNSSNENGKQQSPINPEEAKQAADVAADALNVARKNIENINDYKPYPVDNEEEVTYFKEVNKVYVGIINVTIPNPDSYAGVINMLWDVNGERSFDNAFIKGNASKVYNENLIIRQQRYKNYLWGKHYNVVANKIEVSKDETAIVLASSDMKDHVKGDYRPYINPLVKSANSFKPEIDSEDVVINGVSIRMYAHLVAFFIKKEADCVKITHIASYEHMDPMNSDGQSIIKLTGAKLINIIKLKDIFKKK
ncbi:fam-a protein [Plasmodium chabaudi adami]|uniref:Fam-a protein n=1 Tax=Plasmodium chabaudi adami TaxID=5826 RepID=A0A1D3LA27_PLACE|nr:fam-a protein [Plasmodium chabaudi adami]